MVGFTLIALSLLFFAPSARSQDMANSYQIRFQEYNALITGPRVRCPTTTKISPLCLNGSIILDPGHDDQSDSKRNPGKNFNEGRSNMLVSLIVRDLLVRCSGLNERQVKLIRWPGEEFYNEYENPRNAEVSVHQPGARLDGLQSRVEELANQANSGLTPAITLSLHSNSSGSPSVKPDRVEIFYPENSSQAVIEKASTLKEALVRRTLGAYQAVDSASLKKIQQAVLKKSFFRSSDFAVLTKLSAPESMVRIVAEMFYMDSSQKKYLDEQSDLKSPSTQRISFLLIDSNGKNLKSENYPLTQLQSASALGVYEGLAEIYSCKTP